MFPVYNFLRQIWLFFSIDTNFLRVHNLKEEVSFGESERKARVVGGRGSEREREMMESEREGAMQGGVEGVKAE